MRRLCNSHFVAEKPLAPRQPINSTDNVVSATQNPSITTGVGLPKFGAILHGLGFLAKDTASQTSRV